MAWLSAVHPSVAKVNRSCEESKGPRQTIACGFTARRDRTAMSDPEGIGTGTAEGCCTLGGDYGEPGCVLELNGTYPGS
jgi:hypothetical protein